MERTETERGAAGELATGPDARNAATRSKRPRRRRPGRGRGDADRFTLYVEGPRDREILKTWARRVSPRLARSLDHRAVILGGRQPARAIEHFRRLGGAESGASAICVLDRDGDAATLPDLCEPGLEFYTWRRRHIESYLLVPGAIRRCLGLSRHDAGADRLLREHLPEPEDEHRLREIDAKRLLAHTGPLTRALGLTLEPGRIARKMRESEIHPEVIGLLDLMNQALGLPLTAGPIVIRSSGG